MTGRPTLRRAIGTVYLMLITAWVVAGCGGGGGGSATTPPGPVAVALPAQVTLSVPARAEPGVELAMNSSLGAGTDGLALSWDFGDGSTSMQPQPRHSFAAPGSYELSLTVRNSAGQSVVTRSALQIGRFSMVADRLCSGADGSGWCWQAPLPERQPVSVERFFSAELGVVAGPSGWFEITTDGGKTWTRRARQSFDFVDVVMLDADNGWALESSLQAVHRTRDGGRSWQRRPVNLTAVANAAHLIALGGERLIVAGQPSAAAAEAFYTVDGGASWSLIPSPSTPVSASGAYLRRLDFPVSRVDPSRTWSYSRFADWGATSTPLGSLPTECRWTLLPLGEQQVWATCHSPFVYFGGPIDLPRRSAMRLSTDAGRTWQDMAASMPSAPNAAWTLTDVALDAQGQGFGLFNLLLDTLPTTRTLLRAGAGSTHWQALPPTAEFGAYNLPFLPILDARTAWLLDAAGRAWWSDDGAATWRRLSNPAQSTRPGSLVRDGGGGLLARYDGPDTPRYRSADRGSSWNKLPGGLGLDGGRQIASLWFFDALRGMALMDDGSLRMTYDGGRSWARRAADATSANRYRSVGSLVFSSAARGWLIYSGELKTTADGGLSWARAQVPAEMAELEDVHFVSATHGWAITHNGRLYATRDGGQSWAAAPQPAGASMSAQRVRFFDERNGVLVVNEGNIDTSVWHSNDGGQTWRATNFKRGGGGVMSALVHADARTVWMSGQRVVGESLWKSSDAGATWQPVAAPTEASIVLMHFVDAQRGWVYGDGALFATEDGGLTWRRQTTAGLGTGLTAMFWIDAKTGWLGGPDGALLATATGGR